MRFDAGLRALKTSRQRRGGDERGWVGGREWGGGGGREQSTASVGLCADDAVVWLDCRKSSVGIKVVSSSPGRNYYWREQRHFCRDKTRLLLRQKYACQRARTFVATKIFLSRQKYVCILLSRQKYVCILLSRRKW